MTDFENARAGRIGHAAIVVGCACAASGTLLTKDLVSYVPVLPLVFLQLLSGTLVVGLFGVWSGNLPRADRIIALGSPGILQPGLSFTLSFAGLRSTSVSVEGLLFSLESALVAILAWPLLGERPTRAKILALAAGTVGVALVAGIPSSTAAAPLAGVLMVLAGVICAALDTVASRRLAGVDGPVPLTFASQVMGLFAIGLTVPFWPAGWDRKVFAGNTWPLIFFSGVLLHAAAVLGFNIGLSRLPASNSAMLFPLVSIMAALGGYVWFGEMLGPVQVVGGTLIVAGALMTLAPNRTRVMEPEERLNSVDCGA